MGRIWDFLTGGPMPAPEPAPLTFAIDADAIDPAVFGLTSYAATAAKAPRIDRATAMQVPAVKRARDLIAGSIGGLPLAGYDGNRLPVTVQLFEQPERNTPRSVTMARTAEDMFFEGIAWWKITEYSPIDQSLYPSRGVRLKPSEVVVRDGRVYVNGRLTPDDQLIRFDSPNDPLLISGARAIRTALALDAAASRFADGTPPMDYFTPADPDDEPANPQAYIDSWAAARRANATAYVPGSMVYHTGGWNPEQLQLSDARQHAVLEIARAVGIDPEELGVSTTSRTYANSFDRRKAFIDFTLAGYINAIADRLSMDDVTPPGQYARFNLDYFLRSDAVSRYAAYRAGLDVGALDHTDIARLEDKPAPSSREETPVTAQARSTVPTFDTSPELRLDAPGTIAFADIEQRTVSGLLVPYGVPGRSNGQLWQFSAGVLKWSEVSRVKLWIGHDRNRAVGVATSLEERPDGLYGTFRIARGAAGDEALSYAADGVLDGFSIGLAAGAKSRRVGDINHVTDAGLMETSLTPAPSFDDARVHSVAAQADQEGTTMNCTTCGQVHAAGVTDCRPEDIATFTAAQGATFEQLGGAITAAITAGFTNAATALTTPQGRQVIAAGDRIEVTEELPYRFNGGPGQFSLIDDLRGMASGNADATQRLETFMDEVGECFAVTTGNVAALNPVQNRPELFVPNLTFNTPLQDSISVGTIEDKTSFTIPKFASASGLVGAHTEGVEPTAGVFTATSQTITPTALSGKVEITREVWDQGGSPPADGIIWGEMLNAWYEAREARIATLLNGLSLTEINLASATGQALVTALTNVLVDLQFVRGGNRYTSALADGLLFKAMVNAQDTSGRNLLPVINPTNAQGQTGPGFSTVNLGSLGFKAAWALGATNASHSYLLVPTSFWQWASVPKRFTFEYRTALIDMAIWGYEANASLRDSDAKRIDYTTADV